MKIPQNWCYACGEPLRTGGMGLCDGCGNEVTERRTKAASSEKCKHCAYVFQNDWERVTHEVYRKCHYRGSARLIHGAGGAPLPKEGQHGHT